MKKDAKFIRETAQNQGVTKVLTASDIDRAHKFAKNGSKEDYYYRLKEFFN